MLQPQVYTSNGEKDESDNGFVSREST
jgi:hypothetical protein